MNDCRWLPRIDSIILVLPPRFTRLPAAMHRPTRQLRNLQAKLARKLEVSRRVGRKARRWKKDSASYQSLSKDAAESK